MRHLMNHLVERHGFRLDPRSPDDHYAYESVDGVLCFFLASRRRLKERDPRRQAAFGGARRLRSRLRLRSDEALLVLTDEMGNPVEGTVTHVSTLSAPRRERGGFRGAR
jgi:hypothetical protein